MLKVLVRLIVYFIAGAYIIADLSLEGPIAHFISEKNNLANTEFGRRSEHAVAKVYGHFISKEDLETEVRTQIFLRGKQISDFNPEEAKKFKLFVLNKMVSDLMVRYVTSLNDTRRTFNEADIDREWKAFTSRFPSTQDFDAALVSQQTNAREMKWLLEARLQQEDQIKSNIEEGATPSEDELFSTYLSLQANHPAVITRHCSHIFLTTLNKDEAEVESQAQDILNKLKQGENFSDLARAFSNDPTTATKGGDLGEVSDTRPLPGELEKKIFDLPEDTPTLVKSPIGIHLIKAGKKIKHSLPDFDTLRPELEAAIISSRKKTLVDLYLKKIREKPTKSDWIVLYPERI